MKRGSALLIVLGMLSFMVISAVAFSAFMRYSRLPSSYLRRCSSSRLLVKAALAEAIEMVDIAIADNPHPGVGYKTVPSNRRNGFKPAESREQTRNHWHRHVYTGTNYLLGASETVSTLTLEGLAYLPPALINEARYYSRHSVAARWNSFGYDAGRFAFCAVDVSDHLNINKIAADIGRGSSPYNRFSLAYAFENTDHSGYTIDPSKWDAFMSRDYVDIPATKDVYTPWRQPAAASGASTKLPLVSIADLNLAINRNGGEFRTYFPFVNYIANGAGDFITTETGPIAEMQRHMAFITDGYFPPAAEAGAATSYDLAKKEFQPFTENELDANNVSLRAVVRGGLGTTETAKTLKNGLAAFGLVALYDYLDEDQVPVSLALPQTERSPMICGIRQENLNGEIAIKQTRDPDVDVLSNDYPANRVRGGGSDATTRTVSQTVYYKIDGQSFHKVFDSGKVTAVVAYPFRRGSGVDDFGRFALDGHLEFFFTRETPSFRTGGNNDIMHMRNDGDFTATDVGNRAVFHVPLKFSDGANSISPSDFSTGGNEDENSVREYPAMLKAGGNAISRIPEFFDNNDNALMTVTYEYSQRRSKNEMTGEMGAWENVGEPEKKSASIGVWPVKDGNADDSVNGKALDIFSGGATYTLHAAVWLRIKNTEAGGQNTVDMVPACVLDDQEFLGNNNSDPECLSMTGAGYPLMLFTGGSISLKEEDLNKAASGGAPVSFGLAPTGVMVSDPRWNWAPEHWYRFDTISKDTWLTEVKTQLGQDGRDTDIFMATSDANYMQSVYELAFLPRLTNLENSGDSSFCGNMTRVANAGRTEWATAFGGAANQHLMWKTYRPYANFDGNGTERDNFENIGSENKRIVNEGGGMKLNPYSDNENILVSAFANTPRCWWAASSNIDTGIEKGKRIKDAQSFNKKYAWCEMNTDAKFEWSDLQKVIVSFKNEMHAEDSRAFSGDWEGAYNDLWADDGNNEKSLMGATLENTAKLYGVDRKYFYGYWRDCFDVKQQLFLIFVRAEPMMMGGGIVGQTPPQLGARAVALVWRNPKRSKTAVSGHDYGPHQTRVLMYRQFD